MVRLALPVSLLALVGCTHPSAAHDPVLEHRFPELSVEPGGERNFVCQSWTLDNDEPLLVNATTVTGGPGWHHTNWLFAPETAFAGPDDTWPCADRGFELVTAGLSGGVLFAPSPELHVATQAFAPGVAIEIPARSKIIAELHLINTADTTLTTSTHLELATLPPGEATVRLQPLAIANYALDLPAQSTSSFATSCDMFAVGGELDLRVYSIEPHYHDLGVGMTVEAIGFDGSRATIHDVRARIGNANLGAVLAEPFEMRPYAGMRMTCHYRNTRAQRIGFGSEASAEMCVMFGFTDSSYKWIGGALAGTSRIVEGGGDPTFASPCRMVAL